MIARTPILPRVTSGILRFYLRAASRKLKPRLTGPDGRSWIEHPDEFLRFRQEQVRNGPAIYVLWIADHVNLLSLGYVSEAFRRVAREFRFFADDSLGGLVMRHALKDVGAEVVPISQTDPAERLKLLRRFMEERPSAFLAVDGRGPYFKVATGLPNLAIALKAQVIPCSILSKPRLSLSNGTVRVDLPLPTSTVLAAFGNPLSFQVGEERRAASAFAKEIEKALGDVRRRALDELAAPR